MRLKEVAKSREVKPIVLPDVDKDTYPRACVVDGEGVMTFCREERETQQLLLDS